jgi:hypothetical protein
MHLFDFFVKSRHLYFALGGFAMGWMYGLNGFAPIGTDFF